MKKRFSTIVWLCIFTVSVLCSCGKKDNNNNGTNVNSSESNTTVMVALGLKDTNYEKNEIDEVKEFDDNPYKLYYAEGVISIDNEKLETLLKESKDKGYLKYPAYNRNKFPIDFYLEKTGQESVTEENYYKIYKNIDEDDTDKINEECDYIVGEYYYWQEEEKIKVYFNYIEYKESSQTNEPSYESHKEE